MIDWSLVSTQLNLLIAIGITCGTLNRKGIIRCEDDDTTRGGNNTSCPCPTISNEMFLVLHMVNLATCSLLCDDPYGHPFRHSWRSTEGTCYHFQPLSYSNRERAETDCAMTGGQLVAIESRAERLHIQGVIHEKRMDFDSLTGKDGFWVSADKTDDGWVWSRTGDKVCNDGNQCQLSNNPFEQCLLAKASNLKLRDYPCHHLLGVVCEQDVACF